MFLFLTDLTDCTDNSGASVEICGICVNFLTEDVFISHGFNGLHGLYTYRCAESYEIICMQEFVCEYHTEILSSQIIEAQQTISLICMVKSA